MKAGQYQWQSGQRTKAFYMPLTVLNYFKGVTSFYPLSKPCNIDACIMSFILWANQGPEEQVNDWQDRTEPLSKYSSFYKKKKNLFSAVAEI
jgi:hypothetical protein